MVVAYARVGLETKAVEVFREMEGLKVEPSRATYTALLHAYAHKGASLLPCVFYLWQRNKGGA